MSIVTGYATFDFYTGGAPFLAVLTMGALFVIGVSVFLALVFG